MTQSHQRYGIPYWIALALAGWLTDCIVPARADEVLLNASYDVSREFYQDYNARFVEFWQTQTGEKVRIEQSHGGSSNQVRAVLNGLVADVVTLNQRVDIDKLSEQGLLGSDWRSRLPDNASPFTSTIVFLVRHGNPKNIRDWDDLIEPGVRVVIPNPKTSGNGRYSYLAAWGYAAGKYGFPAEARKFVGELFQRVPALDEGGEVPATASSRAA